MQRTADEGAKRLKNEAPAPNGSVLSLNGCEVRDGREQREVDTAQTRRNSRDLGPMKSEWTYRSEATREYLLYA